MALDVVGILKIYNIVCAWLPLYNVVIIDLMYVIIYLLYGHVFLISSAFW